MLRMVKALRVRSIKTRITHLTDSFTGDADGDDDEEAEEEEADTKAESASVRSTASSALSLASGMRILTDEDWERLRQLKARQALQGRKKQPVKDDSDRCVLVRCSL